MSLFFSSSCETVLMQVHLDTPQTNLNAGVQGEEQDPYQQYFESKNTRNLMICNGIAVCVRCDFESGCSDRRTCLAFTFGSPKLKAALFKIPTHRIVVND